MADKNYRRFAYRLTGGYIDNNAIAMGSSNTATAATALGTVEIAHGMEGTPCVAFTQIISPLTIVTGYAKEVTVASGGLGSAYLTFIVTSAFITAVSDTSGLTTIVTSQVTANFLWCALRTNQ